MVGPSRWHRDGRLPQPLLPHRMRAQGIPAGSPVSTAGWRLGHRRAKVFAALFADRTLDRAPREVAVIVLVYQTDDDLHAAVDRQDIRRRLGGVYLTRVDECLAVIRRLRWLTRASRAAPGKPALWAWQIPTERSPGDPESERSPGERESVTPTEPESVQTRRSPVGPESVRPDEPSRSGHRPPGEPESVPAASIQRALPDHTATARAVRSSSGASDLSLVVNGRPPNGAGRVPEREFNGHAQPQPPAALTLVDLVRAAQPDMTGDEATAVIAAVRIAGRVDSLTGWAGSPRGQVDIRERLATHRQTTRPAAVALPVECPHGCVGGWLGDPDRPAPCPTHKPHRTNGTHR
jgi:hypothetical protein